MMKAREGWGGVRNTMETHGNNSQDYIGEHMMKKYARKKGYIRCYVLAKQEGTHKKRTTLERRTKQGNSVARHREPMDGRRRRTGERIVNPLITHQYLKRMMEQASRLLKVDAFVSVFLLFFFQKKF